MRRRIALLLVLVFAAATITAAQEEAQLPTAYQRKTIGSKDQTKEFTDTFLRTLVTDRPYNAFALLKAVVPDSETDIERTRVSTEELLTQVRPNFGAMIGSELLASKSLGESFVRYDYLLKFEKNALQCQVTYYKARNTWAPTSIWFAEITDQLYEDLGK